VTPDDVWTDAGLACAARDYRRHRDEDEQRFAVSEMPMEGVLFLALIGTPGADVEMDTPVILALRALRATVDGWKRAPAGSAAGAFVSFADLDLLGHRIGATLEIARRGGLHAPPPIEKPAPRAAAPIAPR
jgi:hypothetical protein